MFVMVDYVREKTVKKSCKYGEYGLFERLLFLLPSFFVELCSKLMYKFVSLYLLSFIFFFILFFFFF